MDGQRTARNTSNPYYDPRRGSVYNPEHFDGYDPPTLQPMARSRYPEQRPGIPTTVGHQGDPGDNVDMEGSNHLRDGREPYHHHGYTTPAMGPMGRQPPRSISTGAHVNTIPSRTARGHTPYVAHHGRPTLSDWVRGGQRVTHMATPAAYDQHEAPRMAPSATPGAYAQQRMASRHDKSPMDPRQLAHAGYQQELHRLQQEAVEYKARLEREAKIKEEQWTKGLYDKMMAEGAAYKARIKAEYAERFEQERSKLHSVATTGVTYAHRAERQRCATALVSGGPDIDTDMFADHTPSMGDSDLEAGIPILEEVGSFGGSPVLTSWHHGPDATGHDPSEPTRTNPPPRDPHPSRNLTPRGPAPPTSASPKGPTPSTPLPMTPPTRMMPPSTKKPSGDDYTAPPRHGMPPPVYGHGYPGWYGPPPVQGPMISGFTVNKPPVYGLQGLRDEHKIKFAKEYIVYARKQDTMSVSGGVSIGTVTMGACMTQEALAHHARFDFHGRPIRDIHEHEWEAMFEAALKIPAQNKAMVIARLRGIAMDEKLLRVGDRMTEWQSAYLKILVAEGRGYRLFPSQAGHSSAHGGNPAGRRQGSRQGSVRLQQQGDQGQHRSVLGVCPKQARTSLARHGGRRERIQGQGPQQAAW